MSGALSPEDVRQLHGHGLSVDEAERQIARLVAGPCTVELVRPCTVGDGIDRLGAAEFPELHALHAEAARAGRLLKFVPASGAATRMFKALVAWRAAPCAWDEVVARSSRGDETASELVAFVEQLRRFPFVGELEGWLAARGADLDALLAARDLEPLLRALLDPERLGLAARPKGLLPFHRYVDGVRTAFEEHLVEAELYAADDAGRCRLHATVSREHRRGFEEAARAWGARGGPGARCAVDCSAQKRSTDTLSLDEHGRPLRDRAGRLILRPGGHGALIHNLDELSADVVFVKNIDNVQPDRTKPTVSTWKRALAGHLLRLQREVFRLLDALEARDPSPALVAEARAFLDVRLGRGRSAGGPEALVAALARPLRVCGVVRTTGEPGGGPFWVRGPDGAVTRQIVETSQVDVDDATQRELACAATHFNPVDLVCGMADRRGRAFELSRFVDHGASIVTRKSEAGREISVLERPGLWNGAMAGWNTVFVEVPLETFTPVKTLGDLLRDEHRT
jgi:hypothetical protein